MKYDIVVVGSGIAGLYASLKFDKKVLLITKKKLAESNSFLAQGGICVLRDDYESFFEDTLAAGHYENDHKAVSLMINNSNKVINDLISYNVIFEKNDNEYKYTKEGAHSKSRILYHKDITGKEIMTKLITEVKSRSNITIVEDEELIDIISHDNKCCGIITSKNKYYCNYTILATGGIGGLFKNSTNFPHIKGDALNIALNNNIKVKNLNYVQIHPTTFYSSEQRRFLLTESLRGEGAILLNKDKKRFVDELLPRDVVSKAIEKQMEIDQCDYVYLSLENIKKEEIINHFPNIYEYCLMHNIDITSDYIPVVPSVHYHMGGIEVDYNSLSSMNNLYVVGEASCNGVHGKNRLASNSLLEGLTFSLLCANHINENYEEVDVKEYIKKDIKNLIGEYYVKK